MSGQVLVPRGGFMPRSFKVGTSTYLVMLLQLLYNCLKLACLKFRVVVMASTVGIHGAQTIGDVASSGRGGGGDV